MKRLTIRARITLVTIFVLILLAVILTLTSIYNSNQIYGQAVYDSTADNTEEDNAVYASEDAAEQFQNISLILMTAVIIGGSIFTYFILGIALRPVYRLSTQIQGITENELNTRISDFQTGDELSFLADSFNHLLERLDKAFTAQKNFSSAAAHELKTPLASIKTNIDVLNMAESSDPLEYREVLDVVQRQTDRIIQLLDDLFLVSSNNTFPLEDVVSPAEVIAAVIEELEPVSKEKAVTCSFSQTEDIRITANQDMFYRALFNLVENAVKYNRPGGTITINIEKRELWSIIEISDTGIGISPEYLEYIFTPFFRVDASRSRKIAGSGLGLAIVKDTIERHEGKITVTSEPGKGTCFQIMLPCRL